MKPGRNQRRRLLGVLLVAFVAMQALPYSGDDPNPPAVCEPVWDAQTRALAERACFDCHSNETRWPAYSVVAPASWLIQREVTHARAALNFSEWQQSLADPPDAPHTVLEGTMPPLTYQLAHAPSRLSEAERGQLARGLSRAVRRCRGDEAALPGR